MPNIACVDAIIMVHSKCVFANMKNCSECFARTKRDKAAKILRPRERNGTCSSCLAMRLETILEDHPSACFGGWLTPRRGREEPCWLKELISHTIHARLTTAKDTSKWWSLSATASIQSPFQATKFMSSHYPFTTQTKFRLPKLQHVDSNPEIFVITLHPQGRWEDGM